MTDANDIPRVGRTLAELEELADDAAKSGTLIRSMKAKANERRTLFERTADRLRAFLGSIPMLVFHLGLIIIWLIINTGILPNVAIFDPAPFFFLGFIVATEALVLAILVLISQNRAEKISELRQEMILHVSIISEEETTKLIHMVNLLLQKQGIDISQDSDLQTMLKPTNVSKIEQTLEQDVMESD